MKKSVFIVVFILFLLTGILAAVHIGTREKVPDNALKLICNGESTFIRKDELQMCHVSGTAVNGKGELKEIDGEGVSLYEMLVDAGIDIDAISHVKITASDEFSALIDGEELRQQDKAWLLDDEEDGLRLVVFGDTDSKRRVRSVALVEVFFGE